MHGEPLPEEHIPQDESQEDYKFNYHSAKLTFGLVLLEFNDTVKESDGGRLFELYKLAMLLYKTHGHYKYAYAVLLYLVKCIAILSPSQALRLKWNRTFNGSGLPGQNIPFDLQKEHDNKDIKTMLRNLGANLDEHSAERTAGTLESRQRVYKSVDRDCDLKEQHWLSFEYRLHLNLHCLLLKHVIILVALILAKRKDFFNDKNHCKNVICFH